MLIHLTFLIQDCAIAVSWVNHEDDVDFEMISTVEDAAWVGVALSEDVKMGDDIVVASNTVDASTVYFWNIDAGLDGKFPVPVAVSL